MPGSPIPETNGLTYSTYAICWPTTDLWEGLLAGLITLPAIEEFWDPETGSVEDVLEVGAQILDFNADVAESEIGEGCDKMLKNPVQKKYFGEVANAPFYQSDLLQVAQDAHIFIGAVHLRVTAGTDVFVITRMKTPDEVRLDTKSNLQAGGDWHSVTPNVLLTGGDKLNIFVNGTGDPVRIEWAIAGWALE